MKKYLLMMTLALLGGVTQVKAQDYYVTGEAGITNQTEGEWDASLEGNKMTAIGDDLYQLVVVNKSLTGGKTYSYKITDGSFNEGHNWGWNGSNANFTPHLTGTYDITYIFDSSNNNVYEASALLKNGPDIFMWMNDNWADNNSYKFTNTNGVYTLDVDVSSISSVYYFRFHVEGWDKQCGAYDGNYSLSNGLADPYNITLNEENFYGENNFTLPLDTKPLGKISLTLKFINRKLVMSLKSYEKVTTVLYQVAM